MQKWPPRLPKMTKNRPQKVTPNDAHEIRLFLRTVSFRCVPLIFWDVCWLQFGFMLLMLVLCSLTLSLCWLLLDQVGSRWFMLVEVVPSWAQDASMLAQVVLKMPKMASQGLHNVNVKWDARMLRQPGMPQINLWYPLSTRLTFLKNVPTYLPFYKLFGTMLALTDCT